MTKFILATLTIILVASLCLGGEINGGRSMRDTDARRLKDLRELGDIEDRPMDVLNDDDAFNKVFPFEVKVSRADQDASSRSAHRDNEIQPKTIYLNMQGEREQPNLRDSGSDKPVFPVKTSPSIGAAGNPKTSVKDFEKVKSVAFNSREVRLVGPDQKEVEMKDDLATKVVVVLDNLKTEATDLWGQVNDKLDKGWTEFRSMVERVVEQAKAPNKPKD